MIFSHKYKYNILPCIVIEKCIFLPLPVSDCPQNGNMLEAMAECHSEMTNGSLCQADKTLPDGNTNFDINNCKVTGGDIIGHYDVFVCAKIGRKSHHDMQ